MRPLALLAIAVLAVPSRAAEPKKKQAKPAPTLEETCRARSLDIKILPDAAPAPAADLPFYKPGIDEEAAVTAQRLKAQVLRTAGKDGSRTLQWRRGETTVAQCVELMQTLGRRMPGRVQVSDPRYARSHEAVTVGVEAASADVGRTGQAFAKAQPQSNPGFFSRFFDGGTQAPSVGVFSPEDGRFGMGAAPDGTAVAAAAARSGQSPAASGAAWRDGTPFPTTFNPYTAAPPQPSIGEAWYQGYMRSAARAADTAINGVRDFGRGAADYAGRAWRTAGDYADRAATWAKENLIRAPLAHFARISSTFGSRFHPIQHRWKHHSGVDYAAAQGTAVQSAGDGVVESAGWMGGYGNAIVIRHASGTQTLYGHLSRISVRRGQPVTQGRVIGNVGATGQATGPHLHYEVRRGGVPIDPLKVATL